MKRKKRMLMIVLISILSVVVIFLAVFLLFQTRKIEVTGNQYCSDEELVKWIQKDELAFNSLYIWFKYNYTDVEKPAAIESVTASMKNPWTVEIKVKEKTFLGYFDYDGAFLYFDDNGTAALKTSEVIEGAPFIEGLGIDESKVKMNQELPVTDEGIFEKIVEVTRLLNKYELFSDRLSGEDGNISLFFGVVTVQLGSGDYEQKIAQISPILEKLDEQFAGQAGVLHLEKYDSPNSAIRFVPETAQTEDAKADKIE